MCSLSSREVVEAIGMILAVRFAAGPYEEEAR
jgi:hypothetical protein